MTPGQRSTTTAGQVRAHDGSQVLRTASLRVTKPRLAVLAAVAEHPHASTAVVIAAAREELPDVSHQAVYDTLHTLTSAGILRRIQPSGSVARYETRVGDNHHHLVCRACHSIVDVDCVVGESTCLTPSHDHGFRVDEADVTFWGLCPSCSAKLEADEHDAGDRPPAAHE
ncbi:transcriptional repressor [Pseudoclavibacter endophyticus]|uniref:Transcriptional repressor n=1 Tax=Pseudoclavibacter endophyticus TaxID=1778590 RepID=A0A6H9WMG3_9MICO|nr:Fur family transcriptional regulator [Pseudoclavibacter endophyticus]KAB1647858.1 transcriptional repressor [Pseudoclavibacter endophyticus]GGA73375.1 transcriptional repressor [Pseudoclavibacter endophyticus]